VVLEAAEWELAAAAAEEIDEAVVVRLLSLPEGAAVQLKELIPDGRETVLDLRDLVWGLEDEAIAVADLFVGEGILGGWSGRKAGSQQFAASPSTISAGSLAVLIGPNTEGVGEILAAALQRVGAPLVGSRTVGHAPHMRMIRDGALSLWIPVGEWLGADGSPINDNGVEPDEVVETDQSSEPGEELPDEEDPVLNRALELIRRPLAQAA
jgi:C-terminal processing protease CtpA/Prc